MNGIRAVRGGAVLLMTLCAAPSFAAPVQVVYPGNAVHVQTTWVNVSGRDLRVLIGASDRRGWISFPAFDPLDWYAGDTMPCVFTLTVRDTAAVGTNAFMGYCWGDTAFSDTLLVMDVHELVVPQSSHVGDGLAEIAWQWVAEMAPPESLMIRRVDERGGERTFPASPRAGTISIRDSAIVAGRTYTWSVLTRIEGRWIGRGAVSGRWQDDGGHVRFLGARGVAGHRIHARLLILDEVDVTCTAFDVAGRRLAEATLSGGGVRDLDLELPLPARGMCFLRARAASGTATAKVVVPS